MNKERNFIYSMTIIYDKSIVNKKDFYNAKSFRLLLRINNNSALVK